MVGKILKGPDFKPTLNGSLGEFFFNHAEKYKNNICQIDADSDQSETYGSVKERSVRLAINLQKKGITHNDVVVLCTYNSLDNIIPMLSAFYLGAKVANLDPTLSTRTTKHLLELVKPRIIFAEEGSVKLIESCLNEAKLLSEIIVLGKSEKYDTFSGMVKSSQHEDTFKPTKVDVHDTVVMFFSSGTTGLPKAICHSHQSILRIAETLHNSDWPVECMLHFTTFYWISAMMILTHLWINGNTRVFARNMEGESTLKMIEKYKVTCLFVAPIFTYRLTAVPNPEKYDLSSFRFLLTGGTALSTDQYKKLCSLFSTTSVILGYGMSEVGLATVFHHQRDKHFLKTKIGSAGKATPGTSIKVVNIDNEELVGPNQKGEIRMKSECIMQGYYNMNDPNCFDRDGFVKSGDIGYYDEDDCIFIVERMKEMFKYLSWHIVPTSIEAVLLEHPAVKETVVFGIPRAEEGEVPAACVVLKENYNVTKEEIEKFVEERVSDREKLRGGIIFVSELPKTPTGKPIRNEARNIAIKSM